MTFTVNPAGNGASASLSAATAIIGSDGIAQVTATANSIDGPLHSHRIGRWRRPVARFPVEEPDRTHVLRSHRPEHHLRRLERDVLRHSGQRRASAPGTERRGHAQRCPASGRHRLVGAFSTTFDTGGLGVAGSPYTISYAYTSDGTFASASTTSTLSVMKATPTITWANPADITYGTAISATQLNATATWTVGGVNGPVAGSFTYTPAAGTVLNAGAGQTLSVTFTPTDTTDYNTASDSVTINVDKATPIVTWASPADITYGTALSAAQLDAAAAWTVGGVNGPVAGSFTYTPAAGTVLNAGTGQTLSVTFTPTDTTDYNTATHSVTINVDKATPIVTWANPADITYGTALSATQLNAAAAWTVGGVNGAVAGSFTYTPAAGTVLNAGTGQTLSVTFTPTDYDQLHHRVLAR